MNRLLLLIALLLPATAPLGAIGQAEQYHYQVTYRGVFSLGEDMPIADATLQTVPPATGAQLTETRLDADSRAYPVVESLYPIRHRLRSWAAAENGYLVGFESYEQTPQERRRLYLSDASALGVTRFNLSAGKGQQEIAQLDAGLRPAAAVTARRLFDRLGMLQLIRGTALQDQMEYRLPVTSGREPMEYRVKVEGTERLQIDGRSVPAWKLRFEGYGLKSRGGEQMAHRPVFIWLSQDARRIPLRADARHAVGLFRLELKPAGAAPQLARAAR